MVLARSRRLAGHERKTLERSRGSRFLLNFREKGQNHFGRQVGKKPETRHASTTTDAERGRATRAGVNGLVVERSLMGPKEETTKASPAA
jgi:hypothetical protein